MIKPFEIVSTIPDASGNVSVNFTCSRASVEGLTQTVDTIEAYLLLRAGSDIDAAIYAFLAKEGWIE